MRRNTGFLVPALVCLLVPAGRLSAQIGENLAFKKTATQSSTLGSFRAGLAVDGDRGNFTSTVARADLPGPAWWRVDLGESQEIGLVLLWNRTTCCRSRLRDIIVEILAEDGQTVVYQTTDPDAPDPVSLLNAENELGTYPGGPANLAVDLGEEPVEGRFLKVYRLPDEDLSGTDGQGTPDESTVLSLGEVEVYAEGCPNEGDTFCELLDAVGPEGTDTVGVWTFTVDATDDSGDSNLIYRFTATHEGGTTVSATLSNGANQTTLNLSLPGTWTVSVTVDDDTLCTDESDDAICVEEIEVEPLVGFTEPTGRILSKEFLVLGPFGHTSGCNGPPEELLLNHIANARIDCEYPVEGDPIDYNPGEGGAATTAYFGPEADGVPTWRAFDDGSPDDGDQDLNGDVGAMNDVMSWLVTYVEYTGDDPVEVEFCLGNDDGGQLWLDNQRLISDSACGGRADCELSSQTIPIEKGVHRIAAAAWNRGGGWGLRVSLREGNFGPPIVDGTADWRFLGRRPPESFEPPECEGCDAVPVRNLICEVVDDELVLSWENPPAIDPGTPTRIVVDDGFDFVEVTTVPSDATTAVIPDGDLPAGFTRIGVIHCGGVPATCSPFKTDIDGSIIGEAFLVLGPFTHPYRCNGPASNLLKNHLAPSDMSCLYPEVGDVVRYDPDLPDNASTGYVGPTSANGLPIVRRFDDGSAEDGDQNLNEDVGQTNNVMSWLFTYVEYVGQEPMTLRVCFGSGDGGQLWVNDQVLTTNPKCRNRGDCQDQATLELQGPTVLRVAAGAWNSGGAWGLRVRLMDEDEPIFDSVDNDDWIYHGTRKPDGIFPCDAAFSLRPGDVNNDGEFNLSDPVAHLGFLFAGQSLEECFFVPPSFSEELSAAGLAILDFNGDGDADITDAIGALSRLFSGGLPHVLGDDCVSLEGSCVSNCQ